MKYTKTSTIWLILLYAAMILFACIMESCRSERVITVPEYHTLVAHQHDTLIQRDTVEREKRTIVRQLDSTAMADYGIRLENAERAWLVQTAPGRHRHCARQRTISRGGARYQGGGETTQLVAASEHARGKRGLAASGPVPLGRVPLPPPAASFPTMISLLYFSLSHIFFRG